VIVNNHIKEKIICFSDHCKSRYHFINEVVVVLINFENSSLLIAMGIYDEMNAPKKPTKKPEKKEAEKN